jgi:hypothetical protein
MKQSIGLLFYSESMKLMKQLTKNFQTNAAQSEEKL